MRDMTSSIEKVLSSSSHLSPFPVTPFKELETFRADADKATTIIS